ncbi:MAG: membrane-bound proton-translocating pyrophosphatase [archaeon GW2011_AR5]|nr:MAG: membrane-bound proton-translocating pyrophosphatase [archaeon GW2011_AR5]
MVTFEFALGSGVLALLFAFISAVYVLRQDKGSPKMIEISKAIHEGASAFLKRQYRTIAIFTIVIAIILGVLLGINTAASFVAGAILSALAGFIGMNISIRANVRTAKAAEKGISHALSTAFRGGAVTGFSVVGLGLLGIGILYWFYGDINAVIGFAFGASLVSLFARVGGGIYTKAADVGADLVGKVEKGIPEDDPRNPAVIADNVGDNVGDCAGMGADLFESYVVTLLAVMILGAALTTINGIILPLTIAGVGIIASIIGVFFVRASTEKQIWTAFNKGILVSAVLAIIGTYAVTMSLPNGFNLFLATTAGIVTSVIISFVTDYYTSMNKKPVQEIAKASETGAGTNIIYGLAVGFQSTFIPVIIIALATLGAFYVAGIYGIGLAALGLLSITGMIMAIDSYGPISDNAGGIAEMSGLNPKVRKVTDALDAVGNTTKATTKGVAIASAALSALALFVAFAEASGIAVIDILDVKVLVGMLIGGAIPFLFSAFTMKAVGRAAYSIVIEVRRQFRTMKGIMSGKQKPDYGKCVDIAAKAALKELIAPALLAVLAPVVVGILLGPAALAGLLAGSIVSGVVLALMLSNAGGAWDNAKKYIETGKLGGKGSDAHKAAVTGDTVGDPCKDVSGPSINSLIKVMSTISLIIAAFIAISA